MTVAQDAYAAALTERDELRGRLGAYAAKAATLAAPTGGDRLDAAASQDLGELEARATGVLDHEPADLPRARALVAAYQAYLGSAQSRPGRPVTPQPGATP
jgi:hypothetical protein